MFVKQFQTIKYSKKHSSVWLKMSLVLEKVPEDMREARVKNVLHTQILKKAIHKTDKLKSKISKKIKPNLGKWKKNAPS